MEYTYLTVIERALNSKVVNVRISDSSHLGFLDGRDPSLGVEDENRDIRLVTETIDGSTDNND